MIMLVIGGIFLADKALDDVFDFRHFFWPIIMGFIMDEFIIGFDIIIGLFIIMGFDIIGFIIMGLVMERLLIIMGLKADCM